MKNSTTITQIDVFELSIPLKDPFIISLGPIYTADNVVVRLQTAGGYTGFGECSPFMMINGESVGTCSVVAQYLAQYLTGKDATDIAQHNAGFDKVIYGNNSIKSAFDMALYDIAAQQQGLPLYQYLGGSKNKTIITDYTVSVDEPEIMAAAAMDILQQGYPAIKIKLGKNGATDVERIKAIRQAVGNDVPLRIDANQGWEVEEAITTLQALDKYGIQHCEEPIARWNFMQLPYVKANSPIKIMADECCGDHHDAERLIALNACDYLNIKLGKSGGIFNALKMVQLAETAGLHLQVGAFMESRLAMSAFAHFSLCSPAIEHFDFDTCLMFSYDPVTGGIQYLPGGVIEVTDTPGLGASFSEAELGKMKHTVSVS